MPLRLDDLIEMKAAAGRPKDMEDLKCLRELRERRDQGHFPKEQE